MDHRRLALIVILGLALALLIPMALSAAPSAQPDIPHPTAAPQDKCTTCHTVGGAGVGAPGGTGLAASHQGRSDATCLACHKVAAVSAPAATATAAPAPTAAPTVAAPAPAAAAPTAAAAAPTATAIPAAAATATPTALPKTGGLPFLLFVVGGVLLVLAAMGIWRFAR